MSYVRVSVAISKSDREFLIRVEVSRSCTPPASHVVRTISSRQGNLRFPLMGRSNPRLHTVLAALPGFEPRLAEPDSAVTAELHHRALHTRSQVGEGYGLGTRHRTDSNRHRPLSRRKYPSPTHRVFGPPDGFEPPTRCLQDSRSGRTELRRPGRTLTLVISQRSRFFSTGALPTELQGSFLP